MGRWAFTRDGEMGFHKRWGDKASQEMEEMGFHKRWGDKLHKRWGRWAFRNDGEMSELDKRWGRWEELLGGALGGEFVLGEMEVFWG